MTSNKYISDSILYIGVDDPELPLFESQYMLENGMAYNSYLIRDEKIAVMDAVDARKIDEWMARLSDAERPTIWWCSMWSPTIAPA